MQNPRIAELQAFGQSIGFQIDSSADRSPSTGTWGHFLFTLENQISISYTIILLSKIQIVSTIGNEFNTNLSGQASTTNLSLLSKFESLRKVSFVCYLND